MYSYAVAFRPKNDKQIYLRTATDDILRSILIAFILKNYNLSCLKKLKREKDGMKSG